MPSRQTASLSTYAGVFLIALSTLMYEILLTRIFSVTMWYHFAFVAISVAMFGMTAGALVVSLRPRVFTPERARAQLAVLATSFAALMVVCFLTQLSIPFLVHPSVVAAYALAFMVVVIALPFVVSGMAIAVALTRFPAHVSRLYAADLAGAAVGCVLLVALLRITDGPTAVIFVAAIAALSGVCFAWGAGERRVFRLAAAVAIVLTASAAIHTGFVWRQFPVFRILYIKGALEARPLFEKWNSYSRVRVNGRPGQLSAPYGWGLSTAWPRERLVPQLQMDIDVSAGTVLTGFTGDLSRLDHLKYDVTNAGYYLRPGPRVAVIGVGGGRDVLSALSFGATHVTAIEINDDIIRTVNGRFGDFTGHLDRDPRVRFVNDEARSWLARQRDTFDVVQISLIDTWAATAAGAFVLSENSLYTVEAWRLFLDRLTDRGILAVSRWYFQDRPGEVYRLVALASRALQDAGVREPRRHMLVIRNLREAREDGQPEGVGTLLLSRTPFDGADISRLEKIATDLRFEVVLGPHKAGDATFDGLTRVDRRDSVTEAFPLNIAPPTDDSPFFFHMLRLHDLANVDLMSAGKNRHNLQAVFVLGVLTITVVGLAALCLALPWWATGMRDDLAGAGPLVAFFAAIGLGFMLIETSQMQRLIIMLGHPAYGLSVVLFAMLLSSGAGSFLTDRITPAELRAKGIGLLALLLASLVAFGLVTAFFAHRLEGATTPVRIMAAVAILAVPGLFMGMAFPLGMKAAAGRERLTPWLWGVNGALSVCASVLGVGIALTWTISTAFWVGCLAYVVALAAFARTTRPRS